MPKCSKKGFFGTEDVFGYLEFNNRLLLQFSFQLSIEKLGEG
jgi:hypothetical protein